MDTERRELLGPVAATAKRWRRWLPWLVGVPLLAFQLAMPLRYYLSDGRDERFAWRMFSVHHRADCSVEAYEETEHLLAPYDPEGAVDGGWLRDASTVHRAAEAVAELRCDRLLDVRSVVLVSSCTAVDGRVEPPRVFRHECQRR